MSHSSQPHLVRLVTVAKSIAVATFVGLLARLGLLAAVTPLPPPAQSLPLRAPSTTQEAWAQRREGIIQIHLPGSPQAIGSAHATLTRDRMIENEASLWGVFREMVPIAVARAGLIDIVRVRYAGLDKNIGYARRVEIAAAARAFQPDPFEREMPTYARFLFLNALYDVSLAFEHSPLIGCSSVFVAGSAAPDGPLLGRNFDFEAHEVFDRRKAVIVFAETGKVPVASVAWPGLAGVVTGMNADGVAAVVHGARAAAPSTSGQPVLLTVREALASAKTADQAARWFSDRDAMVSHIVLVADSSGQSLVVERIPGQKASIRSCGKRCSLTNHLEGPGKSDDANIRVRSTTSTLDRKHRLDQLVAAPRTFDASDIMSVLRDRRHSDGRALPAGDRRAIDADIATHSVVMNLRSRELWVNQGPHLSGQYIRFDIGRWVANPEEERRHR